MEIIDGEVEISGKVDIVSVALEIYKRVINKQQSFHAKLNFNLKISCEIEGVAIETIYTERLFELSKADFDKLVEKVIIKK